jgi:predicted flap endonuclease-1-like 5' DNA nuclease
MESVDAGHGNTHLYGGPGIWEGHMPYKLEEVTAIGSRHGSRLAKESITSTEDLLRKCGTAADRELLSKRTGIASQTLLKWARLADLMRIAGVGPQFAELLEASGVDTVGQLSNRNATTLADKMGEINSQIKVAEASPLPTIVEGWVAQAKRFDPLIR